MKAAAFGSASILGVLVDVPSNTIWACSHDLSSSGIKVARGGRGSALIGFNLKTGAGRLDTVTIKGDDAVIATLKDGFVPPTGVTAVGDLAWVAEGQLDLLYD